jgi:hypothetical protein
VPCGVHLIFLVVFSCFGALAFALQSLLLLFFSTEHQFPRYKVLQRFKKKTWVDVVVTDEDPVEDGRVFS